MGRTYPPSHISLNGLAVTTHSPAPSSPLVKSGGLERRQLCWQRGRSVEAEALSSTKRGRFRRAQPMLSAAARGPGTDFESTMGHGRGRARPPEEPRPVPRLRASGSNLVWGWDITYLPTTVSGICLYPYLVIDVWSRKVVAWHVAEREDPAIAADLVSRACLRERISKGRKQPLILHADNGNAMRASPLESRLEELGVLRSFLRPRVSNDNPYSESLFRTAKYRPDYPRRPFASKEEACQWVASFVDRNKHRHRHSGIKFVTPQQRHSGQAFEICRHRA
ncbi:MAG: transposase family protein, partial [Cyanobacteria bacterium K_DeepCast_35m_m1_288]|nr:transposase family protein [Cyanobacteria bacterium K_DeepCast_35m_m1_288]